ncbi:MAG: Fur family transcriptional regulator [Zetaproteobacteria bacterium CG_4_9_14_3_um_filter_49_83]|nr:MAG: Fur family transcriptional regulator [Zetaproteobacteria bacterium CG1_02_49_23]PIQ30551.1 MAG: Fur family transcriptional regulator [Zetaproteobacteria bacterium CG17_big_fil_post_rev_8_21_14_2_50_50_13]PIY54921.1 MAG: Fur family transcriptional regulator [Zetaproteobacteria bacterium CG_4_10_14_0_8_um_filter_49_80]PJA35584.1 MAG: Fur family transcriptional regulator [Zetaproteobacteria bacterium CG_4_9_14_3_um_filter_49_83]
MQRLSYQRQAILNLINTSNHHWDAEEISRTLSDQGESVGIATVYRGLAALESAGLIESIQLDNKKRYERANKAHHDHLICESCGSIKEFIHPEIEQLQQNICTDNQFSMNGHQLLIFGTCNTCRQNKGVSL